MHRLIPGAGGGCSLALPGRADQWALRRWLPSRLETVGRTGPGLSREAEPETGLEGRTCGSCAHIYVQRHIEKCVMATFVE